ncbi:helix-turn-helix domain-containing protein [Bradyrhizobium sp. HKCCYLS1011]|uniref:helix-turn-helix domain-containing protein n=1 Tax=Bradyrhizobium sp. HKCCYLS1011 TaxID=3420733 RepID=UPI003EBF3EF3
MTASATTRQFESGSAGALLRHWRDLRGKSQLDLALDAGVSQKHISFVESGRSQPSRQMVVDLAEALEVPLRERNAILLAAGYAPHYSDAALDAPSLSRISKALQRMLKQNEPFPAVVMDRYWNVMLANDAAPLFFGCFINLAAWPAPRNLLHLTFDPSGLRPFVVDWRATSRMLLARVYREALGHVIDPGTRQLLEELGQYPDVDIRRRALDTDASSPMIPLTFTKDGVSLSYFSLITTVGTPLTITAQELRLECMIPADDETERIHAEFVARHARERNSGTDGRSRPRP